MTAVPDFTRLGIFTVKDASALEGQSGPLQPDHRALLADTGREHAKPDLPLIEHCLTKVKVADNHCCRCRPEQHVRSGHTSRYHLQHF